MDKQRDFVLRTIEERGVKFVRLWFTDVIGTLKSVAIAPAEVEGAFTEGLGFDGSAIEGLTRSYESDLLAHPDPTTFQILPWRGEIDPTARMFCDITTPDGQPAVADPRHVLKRTLSAAADKVVRVDDPEPWLCHLELQASYERALPWRLLRYNALLAARDEVPVESVLVLLRPEADGPALSGRLAARRAAASGPSPK